METAQEYFEKLFFNPRTFFKEITDYQQIKYFNFVLGIFCIGYGIDRLNKHFAKKDLKGELEQIEFLNNWPMFWMIVCIGGLIGGYIAYLIGGWFLNVRIKWSKGVGNIDKSRVVYIYSSLFVYSFSIIYTLFQTILFDIPYDPELDLAYFDVIGLSILFGFLFHSIYISYNAALTYPNISIDRARIWFLILPGLAFLLTLVLLVIGLSDGLE